MYTIACDFGGTNIKIGIMSEGRLVKKRYIKAYSEKGIGYQLNNVVLVIKALLLDLNIEVKNCIGIGIAMPGIVDFKNNKVISINDKYSDSLVFDFEKWAKDNFVLPLIMDNDANLALIGEVKSGCARGYDNAVLLTLGTGIGTSTVIDGNLLRGKHYQAGCLGGHFVINVNGRKCNCGNLGCAEAEAGSWALPFYCRDQKEYAESMLSKVNIIDVKSIIECMDKGDNFSINTFNYLIDNWSAVAINLIHAYDPEVIIFSGGILKAKDKILIKVSEIIHKRAWTPWGKVKILLAEDPDISVLLGLDYLLREMENNAKI